MKTPEIILGKTPYRSRRTLGKHHGVIIHDHGKPLISFSHNDYLGLAHHPKVIAAAQQALQDYGSSTNASPLVAGHTELHQALEEQLAKHLSQPKALLFSSGTLANYALIRRLGQNKQPFFVDKTCHASIMDGLAQQTNKVKRFPHNDTHFLERWLHKHGESPHENPPVVVAEGVYSMEGDLNLDKMAALKQYIPFELAIDDSHGIGVLGKNGRGTAEHLGVQVNIITGSLGKALASHGGFIAGSGSLIESLIQSARPLIYSTAIPPASASAALTALQIMANEPHHQQALHDNIAYFQRQAEALKLNCIPSKTAIQGIIIPNTDKLKTVHQALVKQGLLMGMIRPPSVPKNGSRLRICLSAAHSKEQIDRLLQSLKIALKLDHGV